MPAALVTAIAAIVGPSLAAAASPALPSPTLTVSGRATIYHDDLAGARERAVEAAMIRALEQYAGVRIEASTLIKKGELIDREVRANTHGFVRSFEVLDTTREGNELVANVCVTVAAEPVEESFRRMMSATTTLLLVREANLGQPVDGALLAPVLADPFFTANLVAPPAASLAWAHRGLAAAFYSSPDPATAKELGLRYLAGVIVVASADTKKLDSGADSLGYGVDPGVARPVVAAAGNVTILSGETGSVIASKRFEDVRGSDASDASRAGVKALEDLGARMKQFTIESLSAYVKELGYRLRVVASGDAAVNGAARLRQMLEDTRWVRRVELARQEPGSATLQVSCVERPAYVIEELRQEPGLEIVRFDAASGEVEVRFR
jgi:hypothetical protein